LNGSIVPNSFCNTSPTAGPNVKTLASAITLQGPKQTPSSARNKLRRTPRKAAAGSCANAELDPVTILQV
jgi:hypothetical protein